MSVERRPKSRRKSAEEGGESGRGGRGGGVGGGGGTSRSEGPAASIGEGGQGEED